MIDTLARHVYRRMPVRAALVGRSQVAQIVRTVVQEWPAEQLLVSRQGSEGEATALAEMEERIRGRQEYGSVLLTLLLSAVLSTVIRLVLEWWWERGSHRMMMAAWRREAL